MTAQRNKLQIDELESPGLPIEFLTENGFSILRAWEINGARPPAEAGFSFLVRGDQHFEREVRVSIDDEVIADISFRTRGRIACSSSFWISCAERHLANYLWENDECPKGNRLQVRQLEPEEIISSLTWKS